MFSQRSIKASSTLHKKSSDATSCSGSSSGAGAAYDSLSKFNESMDSACKSPSKKKSWLRSSFRKAFNRKGSDTDKSFDALSQTNAHNCSIISADSGILSGGAKKCLSDVDENDFVKHRLAEFESGGGGDFSLPTSPLHQLHLGKKATQDNTMPTFIELEEYQRVLRDKECKLTDIRLEALATAHQLDSTKEENLKMRNEIEQLKAENLRMQQFFTSQFTPQHQPQQQSICSSLSSPSPSSSISSSSNNNSKLNLSLSTHQVMLASPNHSGDLKQHETNINEGKRVCVSIYLGDSSPLMDETGCDQVFIGSINISTRTNWESLDAIIKNVFREYLTRLDAGMPTLGLNLNSLSSYYVGEMPRSAELVQKLPDLLPYGYLVGNHTNIVIQLRDADHSSDIDSLCYDTLVQKSRMQCYVSLLLDHRNLLFCGPNGTGKSYLARKIGEFLVKRLNKDAETAIAYFNVEHKTSKDLKLFLRNIAEQSQNTSTESPLVLILDNLHNIGNNADVFLDYFSARNSQNKRYSIYFNKQNLNNQNILILFIFIKIKVRMWSAR